MAESNKQIKFSVQVDRESVRAAKGLLDDLFKSVERLRAASARIGIGGGVGGGGGGFGGISSGATDRSVAGGPGGMARGPAGPRPGSAGGGVVQNLLGISDAGALRSLITGTEQAFDRISSDVRGFVNKAESDLKRLRNAIQGVHTSTSSGGAVSGYVGSGGGGGGGITVPQGYSYVTGGAGVVPKSGVPGAPQPGHGPGVLSGFGQIGQAGLNTVGLGFVGQGMQALRAGAAGAVVGGLGVAAIAGGIYGLGARQSNVVSNLDYQVNGGFQNQTNLAMAGASSVQMYHAGRSRDVRYSMATADVLRDKNLMASLMDTPARMELAKRKAELLGLTPGVATKGIRSRVGAAFAGEDNGPVPTDQGFLASLGNVLQHSARKAISGAIGSADPTSAAGRRAAIAVEMEALERRIPAEQDAAKAEAIQARLATGGRAYDVAQYASDAFMGNVGGRRTGFRGVGRRADGTRMDPAEDQLRRDSRLILRGLTSGEVDSANRSIGGSAGLAYAGLGESVLGAHFGGLSGAEGIVRSAGIAGYGVAAGRAQMKSHGPGVQGAVGTGGLDPVAGGELFQGLLGRAMGLGSEIRGGNTASSIISAAAGLVRGGGQDVAEQMANTDMLTRGLGSWGQMTSGKTAPMYQAYGVLTSMKAAGGFGALSEGLRGADPMTLASVARGGDVPAWMQGQLGPGQSAQKMAADFLRSDRMAPFFEANGTLAPRAGSQAAGLLAKVRTAEAGGGDFTDVLKSEISGLKGGARGRRINEFNQILGPNAVGGAEGLFARELADPAFAAALKATGVHGQGLQGSELTSAAGISMQKGKDADVFSKPGGTEAVKSAIRDVNANANVAESAVNVLKELQKTGLANLPSAVQMGAFVKALGDATRHLEAVAQGRYAR